MRLLTPFLAASVACVAPSSVADVRAAGKKSKKARGFLLGQVMQKTQGQANPRVVSEILARELA